MKKYLVLVVDLFVFILLSGIVHVAVAMVAREWAWFASNVLSLAILGYLRVSEIQRLEDQKYEFLRVAEDLYTAIDDVINTDDGPTREVEELK